ncbi:MAG: cellulosome anchoring protein cohesin region [Actinobacteria bacterium]|nr:cellulosome anchoring protein cohesin region [Actinomycetota bacterium]
MMRAGKFALGGSGHPFSVEGACAWKKMVTVFLAVFLSLAISAGESAAAGPNWLPGFPLRAGENVLLMWMPFPGAASYNVYRGEKQGGPYQKIGTINTNNHMDPSVSSTKTYYYILKPVVGGKEGDASPEVVIMGVEPMKAPKINGHLLTAENKVSLMWDSVMSAAFYNLYRSDAGKGQFNLLSSVQDTKYTDTAVQVGKGYDYRVSAVSNTNVESARSPIHKVVIEVRKEDPRQEQQKVLTLAEFSAPKKVDFDSKGNWYVVDGRGVIQLLDHDGNFLKMFGEGEQGKPLAGFPTGIFVHRQAGDEVYVAYLSPGIVRRFNSEGKLLFEFAPGKPDERTAPNTGFDPTPTDVAVARDGTIWVVENAYFQILQFDRSGKELKRIGLPRGNAKRDPKYKDMTVPTFIYIGPKTGNLFVSETAGQRVSIFSPEGVRLGILGGSGTGVGNFLNPNGISVSDEGDLLVADAVTGKVEVFAEDGTYKYTFYDAGKPQGKETELGTTVSSAQFKGRIAVCENLASKVSFYEVVK